MSAQSLAEMIAASVPKGPMSPQELAEALDLLDLNPTRFARKIRCTPKLVRRMLQIDTQAAPIPDEVAVYVRSLARAWKAVPPPGDWKSR